MDHAYPDRKLYYNGAWAVRYPAQCALTLLDTVFWGSCALLISLIDRRGKWVHACAQNWGASIFRICGVQVQTEGKEKIDREGSYVVMSNHCSLFDIPTVLTSLPFQFRMLAKASLFRIPFMGWYMSRVGYIPVKRDDPKKARESIENAASRVASGLSVLIFPEGTRSVEGEVARFKRGGVNLAHTAAVSVVPVAIIISGRLLPRGSWHADPGVITMRIGDPINPKDFPDPRALASTVRSAIVRMIEERRETV